MEDSKHDHLSKIFKSLLERGEEEEGGKGRTTRDQKPCGKR